MLFSGGVQPVIIPPVDLFSALEGFGLPKNMVDKIFHT
jgi:hypothetical protein